MITGIASSSFLRSLLRAAIVSRAFARSGVIERKCFATSARCDSLRFERSTAIACFTASGSFGAVAFGGFASRVAETRKQPIVCPLFP